MFKPVDENSVVNLRYADPDPNLLQQSSIKCSTSKPQPLLPFRFKMPFHLRVAGLQFLAYAMTHIGYASYLRTVNTALLVVVAPC
jgi:hypothetical protein